MLNTKIQEHPMKANSSMAYVTDGGKSRSRTEPLTKVSGRLGMQRERVPSSTWQVRFIKEACYII